MAIARGFVTEPVQFNLPVLQMPFEAAYAQMQSMQQTKDQFDALAEMMPNYLTNVADDVDKASKYRNFVESSTERIASAFNEGDLSTAMKLLNSAKANLTKEWRPGGIANVLQTRYDQYTKGQQAVQEHTKDFTQPGYDKYFMGQLDAQAQKGTGYNPDTGKYNNISTPNMFGEVNLGNEVDTYLKGWAADKNYNIRQSPDGWWYHVETNERVDAGELQQALEGFYNRPDINRAMQVQSWAQAQNVPANMRDQYTEQFRLQMRQEAATQIQKKQAQIGVIEDLLNSGKDVTTLQRHLNSLGYSVPVNGKLDEETINAAQGYIDAAKESLVASTAAIDQRIQSMTLEEGFMNLQRQTLADAYVPKYAFDASTVKMIANTPKIAMWKMSAAKQAMKALTSTLVRPAPTLASPVKAEALQIGTIPVQYDEAKQRFNRIETGIIENLPSSFQAVLVGRTAPTGQVSGTNFAMSPVKRSRAISQALNTATQYADSQGEEFNPLVYRQALKDQGMNLTDAEFKQHAELFQNRDNRLAMDGINNELSPAYAEVEITGDMYRGLNEVVRANLTDDNIQQILTDKGYEKYKRTGSLFLPGDAEANAETIRVINENYSEVGELLSGVQNVDVIINDNLEPYLDKYKEVFKLNPLQAINADLIDNATLKALGYNENRSRMDQADQPKILELQFGKRNINGKTMMVGLVTTDKSESPIVLSTDQLSANFLQEYVRTGAAAAMNPNNPGEIMDPGAFSMFSSMYYDLENHSGTGYNANTITNMREQGRYGKIGIETPSVMGYRFKNQTLLLPNSDGTQEYLVTTTADVADKILGEGFTVEGGTIRTNGVITENMRRYLEADNNTNLVPIGVGYEGVKNAIDESKATLVDPIMQYEILTNPLKYNTSTTNQTQNALPIGTSLFNMFNY